MNDSNEKPLDTYRSFLLMSEISNEEQLSQRELAGRLGIALGLVNLYLKNLLAKGYIRIKTFPKNRYAYLLTPQGITEKSRLAYQHLSYFTNLYRVTREDYATLFALLQKRGVKKVAFCGVDEVAEIAYLSLGEAGLDLVMVMDNEQAGKRFFGREIVSLPEGLLTGSYPVVVSSHKQGEFLQQELVRLGVQAENIYVVGGSTLPKAATAK